MTFLTQGSKDLIPSNRPSLVDLKTKSGLQHPPCRPMLNLFPRQNPEAVFIPLKTRSFFKTPVEKVNHDSDSSSFYESTTDEDDEKEALTTTSLKKQEVTCHNSLGSSNPEPAQVNLCTPRLKSALKRSEITRCPSLTTPTTPTLSISSSCSSSPTYFNPQSVLTPRTVRIIEPVDALAELHELRRSLHYGSQQQEHFRRRKQLVKALPPSLKLAQQQNNRLTIELVQKAFQPTPPATSSSPRAKPCLSRVWYSPPDHHQQPRSLSLNSSSRSSSDQTTTIRIQSTPTLVVNQLGVIESNVVETSPKPFA